MLNMLPVLDSSQNSLYPSYNARLEQLRGMDTEVCPKNHHFRWQHGGRDLDPCSSQCRRNKVRCSHNSEQLFINGTLQLLEDRGLISQKQRVDLKSIVRNASDALFIRFDSVVLMLAKIWQIYQTEEVSDPRLIEHHGHMTEAYGLPCPVQDIQAEHIEAIGMKLQYKLGQPIELIRRLLIAVLSIAGQNSDSNDMRAKTGRIVDRFLHSSKIVQT